MSDKWILPYKIIYLADGLLAIYEKAVDEGDESLGVIAINNNGYLRVGEDHLIPLDQKIFQCISEKRKIYLAAGEQSELTGEVYGDIDIEDMILGKLMGYLEVIAHRQEQAPAEATT